MGQSEQALPIEVSPPVQKQERPPIDPRVQQRIDDTMKLLQEMDDDPSRLAYPDGILPIELGC